MKYCMNLETLERRESCAGIATGTLIITTVAASTGTGIGVLPPIAAIGVYTSPYTTPPPVNVGLGSPVDDGED